MGFPSYRKYVETGEMTAEEADALDRARDHGRISAQSIPIGDHPLDAVMLGVLDAACGAIVRKYGAAQAGEIFRHYGEVCERNAVKAPGE